MPADLSVDLSALDALFQAATPGEWYVSTMPPGPVDDPGAIFGLPWRDDEQSWAVITTCNPHDPRRFPNAALIAALHNAWPAIRRRLEIGDAAVEVDDAERRYDALLAQPMPFDPDEMIATLESLDAARARLRALREAPDAA